MFTRRAHPHQLWWFLFVNMQIFSVLIMKSWTGHEDRMHVLCLAFKPGKIYVHLIFKKNAIYQISQPIFVQSTACMSTQKAVLYEMVYYYY